MTRKILFFTFIMLLSSSVIFAVEKNPENQSPANAGNRVEQEREQRQAQLPVFKKTDNKKGFFQKRKERRAEKKFIKDNAEALMSSMVLVGAGLMVFGLLLYLVVTSALWLGIAVMVLGLVLLLYGVLTQFF